MQSKTFAGIQPNKIISFLRENDIIILTPEFGSNITIRADFFYGWLVAKGKVDSSIEYEGIVTKVTSTIEDYWSEYPPNIILIDLYEYITDMPFIAISNNLTEMVNVITNAKNKLRP